MLLIEDDDVDAEAVVRALPDWEVTHVESLRDGVNALMSEEFSAVAVDLHLPDGLPEDVVPRVLAAAAGVAPVVVLTGLRDDARAVEFVASGADDHVQKGAADADSLRRQFMFAVERYRRNALSKQWRTRLAKWAHEGALKWVWRIDDGTFEGNDAWHMALEQSRAGAAWDDWLTRVHTADQAAAVEALGRVSRGDDPAWEVPLRVQLADQGFVRGILQLTAVWNPSGVPTVVRGSLVIPEATDVSLCARCGRQSNETTSLCPQCPTSPETRLADARFSGPVRAQLKIGHRYRVEAKIASGASGVVYRATDEQTGKACALKLLHAHLAQDITARSRFALEARLQLELAHPNILQVLDYGQHDGAPYLVLPLVRGGSVAAHLQQFGPFPVVGVLRYGASLADALDAAHASGVVHRDVKPGKRAAFAGPR